MAYNPADLFDENELLVHGLRQVPNAPEGVLYTQISDDLFLRYWPVFRGRTQPGHFELESSKVGVIRIATELQPKTKGQLALFLSYVYNLHEWREEFLASYAAEIEQWKNNRRG